MLRVIPLLVSKVKSAVVCKIPPLKVNCVAATLPGTAPKFLSLVIAIVPLLIIVIPV